MAVAHILTFATEGPEELAFSGGTFSLVAARPSFHADFEARVNPTAGGTGYVRPGVYGSNSVMLQAGGEADYYAVFAIAVASGPASGSEEIYSVVNNISVNKAHVRINANRTLSIYDSADTLLGTTTAALTLNTTYYLGVRTGTGATAAWALRIYDANGTLIEEISGTGDLLTNNNAGCYLGMRTNRSGQAIDASFGPLIVENSVWPDRIGAKRVTLNGNGTPHQWTAGTNTSGYQEIDETPANDADYIMSPSAINSVSYFTDAGFSESVTAFRALLAIARVVEDTGAGTSATGLTMLQGAAQVATGSADATAGVVTRGFIRTTPPAGGTWDLTSVNATHVGIYELNAVPTRCTALWKIVVYTPASGEPSENNPPNKPTCSVFAKTHNSVTLTSSAFSDADGGDTHAASQWQVDAAAGDFSSPVADSGETAVNLTSCTLGGLAAATNLKGRVRHKDDSGDGATEWGAWSDAVAFLTDAEPPSGNLLRLHAIGES